jgi:catecholate siderophore receptor
MLPDQIEIGAGANYVGNRWANTTGRAVGGVNFWELAPEYWTLSTLVKAPIAEGVSLQLNVNNLTDRSYIDLVHPSHVVPGAGRSAMLTLSAKL